MTAEQVIRRFLLDTHPHDDLGVLEAEVGELLDRLQRRGFLQKPGPAVTATEANAALADADQARERGEDRGEFLLRHFDIRWRGGPGA